MDAEVIDLASQSSRISPDCQPASQGSQISSKSCGSVSAPSPRNLDDLLEVDFEADERAQAFDGGARRSSRRVRKNEAVKEAKRAEWRKRLRDDRQCFHRSDSDSDVDDAVGPSAQSQDYGDDGGGEGWRGDMMGSVSKYDALKANVIDVSDDDDDDGDGDGSGYSHSYGDADSGHGSWFCNQCGTQNADMTRVCHLCRGTVPMPPDRVRSALRASHSAPTRRPATRQFGSSLIRRQPDCSLQRLPGPRPAVPARAAKPTPRVKPRTRFYNPTMPVTPKTAGSESDWAAALACADGDGDGGGRARASASASAAEPAPARTYRTPVGSVETSGGALSDSQSILDDDSDEEHLPSAKNSVKRARHEHSVSDSEDAVVLAAASALAPAPTPASASTSASASASASAPTSAKPLVPRPPRANRWADIFGRYLQYLCVTIADPGFLDNVEQEVNNLRELCTRMESSGSGSSSRGSAVGTDDEQQLSVRKNVAADYTTACQRPRARNACYLGAAAAQVEGRLHCIKLERWQECQSAACGHGHAMGTHVRDGIDSDADATMDAESQDRWRDLKTTLDQRPVAHCQHCSVAATEDVFCKFCPCSHESIASQRQADYDLVLKGLPYFSDQVQPLGAKFAMACPELARSRHFSVSGEKYCSDDFAPPVETNFVRDSAGGLPNWSMHIPDMDTADSADSAPYVVKMCETCAVRACDYSKVAHFKLNALYKLYTTLRPPSRAASLPSACKPWWDSKRRKNANCSSLVTSTLCEAMLVQEAVGSVLWREFKGVAGLHACTSAKLD